MYVPRFASSRCPDAAKDVAQDSFHVHMAAAAGAATVVIVRVHVPGISKVVVGGVVVSVHEHR